MKSNLQTTGLKFIAALIPLTACFLYFRYIIPYHVCFKEQIQLFVYSSSYIMSYFSKPAVLACLGGDFLTQFLYLKTGGALVITLLLAVEWGLIFLTLKRFFTVETRRAASLLWCAASLPVIIEWISYPRLSFSLDLSVSFVIALSAFLIYAKTHGKITVAAGILLIPMLYMMAGASVFLFLILAILYDIHCGRRRFVYWAIILALSVVIPVIFRHSFLLTLKQAYFYPYSGIMQGLSLVALALMALLFVCFNNPCKSASSAFQKTFETAPYGSVIIYMVLVSILIFGLVKFTDRRQEKLFGITVEAYHENWDKVLEIAESAELQSPVASCYTNIALSQKNLMGERLMDFYQPFATGLFLPIAPTSGWFAIFAGSDAYYHVGDMDMAQHAAMLGMIFSPNQRSARMAERLAETNMANGDIPAATKYIRMLESTLFYKTKASRLKDKPHQGIFRENILRGSNTKDALEFLIENHPDNLPALNYLLCYYLLNKDIPAFFKAYTLYCKGKNNPVPKVYAEALLIYFAVMKSTVKEVAEYGLHPEIIKSFGEYTCLYEKSNGNLMPVQEKFPNTYWLFYHFATSKQ